MWGTLKARALSLGLVAGLASVLLWPLVVLSTGMWRWPFQAALGVCCLSGATLFALSIGDLIGVRRGARILPARLFDLAMSAALVAPSGLALAALID